jgi:hypothetical protein
LFYRELFLFRCISVNSGKSLLLNHIHLSLVTPHPTWLLDIGNSSW